MKKIAEKAVLLKKKSPCFSVKLNMIVGNCIWSVLGLIGFMEVPVLSGPVNCVERAGAFC